MSVDKKIHFHTVTFMMETGAKLGMEAVPLASAAVIYHRFFQECELEKYDPYMVGTTSLYLAGKVEEQHQRLRDIINAAHRTLHPDKPPLDIGSTYWALRETVVQCELLIVRVLKFHFNTIHPHKYLLHYLKSLHNWLPQEVVQKVPVARTAWGLLRDSYHGDLCLQYKAQHMAVAVLYMSLQCHGVEVPHNHQAHSYWWQVLSDDLSLDMVRRIIVQLIDLYSLANTG